MLRAAKKTAKKPADSASSSSSSVGAGETNSDCDGGGGGGGDGLAPVPTELSTADREIASDVAICGGVVAASLFSYSPGIWEFSIQAEVSAAQCVAQPRSGGERKEVDR